MGRQAVDAAQRPARCAACQEPLATAPRAHGKGFCGAACRVAAYRRRRQGIAEKTSRWEHARGRLRLSKARAFERHQAERLAAAQERAERRERYRRMAEQRAAERATWLRPPTRAELAAMSDEEVLAMAHGRASHFLATGCIASADQLALGTSTYQPADVLPAA